MPTGFLITFACILCEHIHTARPDCGGYAVKDVDLPTCEDIGDEEACGKRRAYTRKEAAFMSILNEAIDKMLEAERECANAMRISEAQEHVARRDRLRRSMTDTVQTVYRKAYSNG